MEDEPVAVSAGVLSALFRVAFDWGGLALDSLGRALDSAELAKWAGWMLGKYRPRAEARWKADHPSEIHVSVTNLGAAATFSATATFKRVSWKSQKSSPWPLHWLSHNTIHQRIMRGETRHLVLAAFEKTQTTTSLRFYEQTGGGPVLSTAGIWGTLDERCLAELEVRLYCEPEEKKPLRFSARIENTASELLLRPKNRPAYCLARA